MSQNEIVIKKNKLKQVGLLMVSFIFDYASYLAMNGHLKSSRYSSEFIQLIGIIGIIFFGFGGILMFYNLLTGKSALVLNSFGIINNSHIGGGYLIRWENIKSLNIITINKQKMISVDLKNDQEIYDQVNLMSRYWMKLNCRMMGTPTFIPSVMIKMNLDDVLNIIREQKKLNKKSSLSEGKIQEDNQ